MRKLFVSTLISALIIISVPAHAYYFTYPYGKGNLYLDGSLSVAKGTSLALNPYIQYGILNCIDVNLWVPGAFYYDNNEKKGYGFYNNPTAGYLISFINTDANRFSTFANFTLPFREPRGFDMDMALIYSGRVLESLRLITGLDVPFSSYSEALPVITLSYIAGAEYTCGDFSSQFTVTISDQVKPERQFGLTASGYVAYDFPVLSPYIEVDYDARPVEDWIIYFGVYRSLKLF